MNKKTSSRGAAAAILLCGLLPLHPDAACGDWPRHFDNPLSSTVQIRIAVDPIDGAVFMAGTFSGNVAFSESEERIALGATDVYVVKYDRFGAFQWVETGRSSGRLTLGGLTLDDSGHVYVAGIFDDNVARFGEHSITLDDIDVNGIEQTKYHNVYLAKLTDGETAGEWDFAASADRIPIIFQGDQTVYPDDQSEVTGVVISGQHAYVSASTMRFAWDGTKREYFVAPKGVVWSFSIAPGSEPPGMHSGEILFGDHNTTSRIGAIGAGGDQVFYSGEVEDTEPPEFFTAELEVSDVTRGWMRPENALYDSIAVDSNGDPHFAGGAEIRRRRNNGDPAWVLRNADTVGVQAVALDGAGDVYFASYQSQHTFVFKYRRGETVDSAWSNHTESSQDSPEPRPQSIAVYGDDVYVAGRTFERGTVEFGSVSVEAFLSQIDFVANLEAVGGNWFELSTWTAGQEIPPPQGAPNPPLEPIPDPGLESYFYWNPTTRKYYAVRQVEGAVVRWPTASGAGAPTIRTNVRIVWPPLFERHVPGATVHLQPPGLAATFQELVTESDATVDAENVFRNTGLGFSVLRYETAGGETRFEVARTSQPGFSVANPCTVGTPILPLFHDDPGGGTGHVVLPAPIDATGPDSAYDVATRGGSILPVNAHKDMMVVWYRRSALGVGWPTFPSRYRCDWPATTDKIVIDELVGSEYADQPLLDPNFEAAQLYFQNDPSRSGFNPNEEHALLAPSNPDLRDSGSRAIFALRRQTDTSDSEPYVLLKYRDAGEWRMKVYQVLDSVAGNAFAFDVEVGQLLPRPYPLGEIEGCRGTSGEGDPYWEDVRGNTYARSNGEMFVTYSYPLLIPDFYPDPDNPVDEHGCVRWLAELPDPRVRYRASWPADPPQLEVGETLITPKRGLPDVHNQAAVEVIFNGGDSGPGPETPSVPFDDPIHLVKLFDPLSVRWVDVGTSDPDLFREVIAEAPFHLRRRLDYDQVLGRLGFQGHLDATDLGDPLLLPNVMSARERDTLQGLRACVDPCDAAIDELYALSRNPHRLDFAGEMGMPDGVADEELLIGLGVDPDTGEPIGRRLDDEGGVLSAGAARGEGYVTLAFNNDLDLTPPISIEVIRVACGPYRGSVQVLPTDNVFDERLTLRHSGDFGGEPERFSFEWRRRMAPYDPAEHGDPTTNSGDWEPFPGGEVDVTVRPESGNPAELIVPDNYYFVHYTDSRQVCGDGASGWAGDPGGSTGPRPKLAEGWIKRVIRGLNPFQARTTDFHAGPTNTYASLLIQAGEPYAGPIAFNGEASNVDGIGLIEAYETVLRRGVGLGLEEGMPFSDAVGTALLLAASKISDLYVLLGNEAFADASDPTIGFGTASGEYGRLAPTIFAFQNQLPSLLDEELALLRGRDGSGAAIDLYPVFNRLIWNFTSGEGEIAYSQVYDVSDQGGDGRIDEADARVQFPQGHGDAWGHYLSALKSHYRLLRNDEYVWRPRAEQVAVAGTAVTVDYRDERKLARAAAARAGVGAEIVNLTYRRRYVEDPAGQWQGYKDGDPERAWGVDDWARRAGQGAYFDWVTANALLPDRWERPGARPCAADFAADFPAEECPEVPDAESFPAVGKIDRTTVPEIGEIVCHFEEIQTRLDEADLGLNPLGLAKGVVPFDVDPAEIDAGKTHFEQVAERAEMALTNAVTVFDHANRLTESLRRNQDTLEDFRQNVGERERDFMNRLIEIFGLPYTDDVGGGGTYPSGYDGPDVYHYMYVDPTPLTGTVQAPAQVVEAFFGPIPGLGFFPGEDSPVDPDAPITVRYEVGSGAAGLVRPASWTGERRAPGEIQRVLSSYYQGLSSYDQALQEYDNLLEEIADEREILDTIRAASASELSILNDQLGTVRSLDERIREAQSTQLTLRRVSATISAVADALVESFPTVVGVSSDATSGLRSAVLFAARASTIPLEIEADAAERDQLAFELAKDEAELTTAIRIADEVPDVVEERQLRMLEQLLREEPVLRLEALTRREALAQTLGTLRAALARGLRLLDELASFRAQTAADVQQYRYQDVAFRLTRNDALQKYRAQFDLAARYAYLAATAYDYETNLLGSAQAAGRQFLTDVVRHRSLGEVAGGGPVVGSRGLADPLARLTQNFSVLKGQLGFNNPQTETTPFSLRRELLRLRDSSDEAWRAELAKYRVENLWDLPEFRRYARPFALEPPPGGSEPGLVIGFEGQGGLPLRTTVTTGQNFFGWPLGGGDSSYDTTNFATRIRSVGVWLGDYAASGLSATPRVYLIPVGADVLRPPTSGAFSTREWQVVDQVLPTPFPIGAADVGDPEWIPLNDSLSGELGGIRRFSRLRAFHDSGGFDPSETTTDSRLIGRSVWNTRWLLIIPGETLLADKERGLDLFIEHVDDVKLFFQTYAYSGN